MWSSVDKWDIEYNLPIILYSSEEEGSYSSVDGDHGNFVAESAGPCSCVRRVKRSVFIEDLK